MNVLKKTCSLQANVFTAALSLVSQFCTTHVQSTHSILKATIFQAILQCNIKSSNHFVQVHYHCVLQTGYVSIANKTKQFNHSLTYSNTRPDHSSPLTKVYYT